MRFILLFIFVSTTALAGVSREVLIRGKIGNEFDDHKVKVTDSLGQTYFLSRKIFPQDFNFKQGEQFAIEVDESVVDKVKILKK